MSNSRWLTVAYRYVGVREVPGPKHNPTITRWLEKLRWT